MRRFVASILACGALAGLLGVGSSSVEAGNTGKVRKAKVELNECAYCAHGSEAERRLPAKPPGTPGNGPGGGGGDGGGGKKPACAKVFAAWNVSVIDYHVNSHGGPAAISGVTFEDYVQFALDEWSCHSGLGESIVFKEVPTAAEADITIRWGNLGGSGILGQAATSYVGGVILHSSITMNSNQAAFKWTAGPAPALDGDGCAIEATNGNTSSPNYDFLSVMTHEIGHALGIAHSANRCRLNDKCYPETMFPCTRSEEYMRRALNMGDQAAIQLNYGPDS